MTLTIPSGLPDLQQKFWDTRLALEERSVEREDVIWTALLCLAGRLSSFYYGPPGVAKSYIVNELVKLIDGLDDSDQYFRILMTGFTTDSELFGDRDLVAMDKGERRRILDKTLATALVAFLDEIGEANSSALKALLTILNEGVFDNGTDGTIEAPLFSVFSASNVLPTDNRLAALFDRLHFWHHVDEVQEDGNFEKVLRMQNLPELPPKMHIDDVLAAQKEVDHVTVADEVYEALTVLRRDLRAENIMVTTRRVALAIRAVQANAWLNGQDAAQVEDMAPIRFMFWKRLDEIPVVNSKVLNLASPLEAEALKLQEALDHLSEEVEQCLTADTPQEKKNRAGETHTNLEMFMDDVRVLSDKIAASGRSSTTVSTMKARANGLMGRVLREAFGVDPDTGQKL